MVNYKTKIGDVLGDRSNDSFIPLKVQARTPRADNQGFDCGGSYIDLMRRGIFDAAVNHASGLYSSGPSGSPRALIWGAGGEFGKPKEDGIVWRWLQNGGGIAMWSPDTRNTLLNQAYR
jgi:hypothetical protein